MARAEVLQKDIDALLQTGKLSVKGDYRWKRGAHKLWVRAEIPVDIKEGAIKGVSLKIVLSASFATNKCDFVLLWNNIPIRRLCINGSHTNRHTDANRWTRKTHKHKWTDNCMDRFAYTPTDITATDVPGQFGEFCAECGVECSATLDNIPANQGGMFDEV